jgi:hypothetical protein
MKGDRLVKRRATLLPASFVCFFLAGSILLSLSTLVGCSNGSATPPNPGFQDFDVVVSPATVTANAGTSTSTFTVSTTGKNGFAGAVAFAISGLPTGATTSPPFPFSVPVSTSRKVTLSVPASTGNFPLTVTATSGSLSHSAPMTLKISSSTDFSIGISPTSITAAPGSSGSSFTVSVAGQNGFKGSVSVAITGLPAGTTTSPSSPFSVAAGFSQNVSFAIPGNASVGSYTVALSATAASVTHTATLALTVSNAPDFNLGLSPIALAANAGTSPTFNVSVTGVNGFTGAVSISISGLPAGASTSPLSPFSVAAGNGQTVSLSIPTTATPGNYSVVLNGTSGSLAHSATLALTVNPPPDFSIALSPTALTATAGTSTATFTVSITGQNGFTGSPTITLSGLPSGVTSSPASPFTVAAGSSQPVTLTIPSTTASGDYTVSANGNSGSLTHSAVLDLAIVGPASITTWHYDNARTGANINETTLTPSNVNSVSFGKLATLPVDGFVVGHPLYLESVNIAGVTHNVVYVATMHDSVFAFDADSMSTTPLWMTSILNYSPAGATTVPATVKKDGGTTGWTELGIISTPVIDPAAGAAGILYLVAETYENGAVVHRLHALDVTTGLEVSGGPTTIAATYTLNGVTTTFADLYEMNRPGLLLANGHIYIGFGSNGNNNYSQGWVLSYNALTLQQEGTYTAEPGKTLASVWQKGAGLSSDSDGYIYGETGEGFYAAGTNLSTSLFKLSQSGLTLALADWFTPYNYPTLSKSDLDLANAVVVLPDQPGTYPHEAVTLGKVGPIYVVNRDNMGQLCTTCTIGDTQIVQEIPIPSNGYTTPVYWNNIVYIAGAATPISAYTLSNGLLTLPPFAQSAKLVGPSHAMITANGNTNGILWAVESGTYLMAMDAMTLNTLYTSKQAANGRDSLPALAHFASPVAANGKIFVGTQNSVVVYGLLF